MLISQHANDLKNSAITGSKKSNYNCSNDRQPLVIVKNGLFSPISEQNLKENDNKSSGSDTVTLVAALLWHQEEE